MSGGLTIASALGEIPSAGGDTPVTVFLAGSTGYFGTVSTVTGGTAAILNSYAAGNFAALKRFSANSLIGLMTGHIAEKVSHIRVGGSSIGGLMGQALGVINSAKQACQ